MTFSLAVMIYGFNKSSLFPLVFQYLHATSVHGTIRVPQDNYILQSVNFER